MRIHRPADSSLLCASFRIPVFRTMNSGFPENKFRFPGAGFKLQPHYQLKSSCFGNHQIGEKSRRHLFHSRRLPDNPHSTDIEPHIGLAIGIHMQNR